MDFAKQPESGHGPLDLLERQHHMADAITQVTSAMRTLGLESPWSAIAKVSDDFLKRLFVDYYGRLGLPNLMEKKSFYELAELVPEDEIDPEIVEKLDAIVEVAQTARPAGE